MMGMPGAGPVARRSRVSPQPQGSTLLQQDPVCGTYVASDLSLKRIVRGKVVHFCSTECRDRFQVNG
jgi:YHS domain-containing protein